MTPTARLHPDRPGLPWTFEAVEWIGFMYATLPEGSRFSRDKEPHELLSQSWSHEPVKPLLNSRSGICDSLHPVRRVCQQVRQHRPISGLYRWFPEHAIGPVGDRSK